MLEVRGVIGCVLGVKGVSGVLLTFETVVMYGHFDESRGLPGVVRSLRSPQNLQFPPGWSKMVLCQPKPLHNIYYVSNA